MIITDEGVVIRISLSDVAVYGRNAQGVKLINIDENKSVATIAIVDHEEDIDEELQEDE
jgi:DNA gyrase subunit A